MKNGTSNSLLFIIIMVAFFSVIGSSYAYGEFEPVIRNAFNITVESNPQGIQFTIDGVNFTTPYAAEYEKGSYNVTMPKAMIINEIGYEFRQWSEGTTTPEITVTLEDDLLLSAQYEKVIEEPPEPEPEETDDRNQDNTVMYVLGTVICVLFVAYVYHRLRKV